MKPKRAQATNTDESSERDRCQTPPYALTPLLPFITSFSVVWESAAGEGLLAAALRDHGYAVYESDILDGENFFEVAPPDGVYIQITNPPFSAKYEWLKHSYEIGLPFALLLPIDVLGAQSAQTLFKRYGVEIIFMSRRVDFKMPNAGWSGKGAQFSTAWFTNGLGIGQPMTFATLHKPNKQQLAEMDHGVQQLALFAGGAA